MTYPDPHSQYSHHYAPRRYEEVPYREEHSYPQSHPQPHPPHPQPYPQRSAYRAPTPTVTSHRPVARPVPRPGARTQPPRRRRRPTRSQGIVLASGGMVALAVLAIAPRPAREVVKPSENVVCQEKVQSESVLSRAELSTLLTVPERATKEAVREVIDTPYCTLSSVEVREGAIAEREAYPLEFDPQTWFIVLYEEGEYAGFDFSFQRE